jgi:hypothetical protein
MQKHGITVPSECFENADFGLMVRNPMMVFHCSSGKRAGIKRHREVREASDARPNQLLHFRAGQPGLVPTAQ